MCLGVRCLPVGCPIASVDASLPRQNPPGAASRQALAPTRLASLARRVNHQRPPIHPMIDDKAIFQIHRLNDVELVSIGPLARVFPNQQLPIPKELLRAVPVPCRRSLRASQKKFAKCFRMRSRPRMILDGSFSRTRTAELSSTFSFAYSAINLSRSRPTMARCHVS
jgi:hypothetical protein